MVWQFAGAIDRGGAANGALLSDAQESPCDPRERIMNVPPALPGRITIFCRGDIAGRSVIILNIDRGQFRIITDDPEHPHNIIAARMIRHAFGPTICCPRDDPAEAHRAQSPGRRTGRSSPIPITFNFQAHCVSAEAPSDVRENRPRRDRCEAVL